MKYVPSTLPILTYLAFDKEVPYSWWVDWAVDMVMAGHETEHLIILAGECQTYNEWDLDSRIRKVYAELNLPPLDKEALLKEYTRTLVRPAIEGNKTVEEVLYEIGSFYETHTAPISDFTLLRWSINDEDEFCHFFGPEAVEIGFQDFTLDYFRKYLGAAEASS